MLYRQLFLENVAECQSSIPLITKDPKSNDIMMYDFALRKIKKVCTFENKVEEIRVVKKPMPIVSFIRLESAGKLHSKSKMINQLLGVSHNYFFHREVGGSSTTSYLLPGTIEIGWYLPKKRGINAINQCTTFLNLRGNSQSFPKQVSFLQKVSNMIFLYVSWNRMTEQEWQFINKLFCIHGGKFVLVLEEKPRKSNYNLRNLKNLKNDKKNFIILTENLSSDKDKIIESINYYTEDDSAERYSIEKCAGIATELGIMLESKSINQIDISSQLIEQIFDYYYEKTSNRLALSSLKNEIFNLQKKWWKEWSASRRYINRIQICSEGIESHQANIQKNLIESRVSQVEHLASMVLESSTLQNLTMYLINNTVEPKCPFIFFRILKLFLEDQALDTLPKLHQEFKKNEMNFNQESNEDWESSSIGDRLLELEEDITDSSLGEEHIMREFAQIFESTTTVDTSYLSKVQVTTIMNVFNVMELPKNGSSIPAIRFTSGNIGWKCVSDSNHMDQERVPRNWEHCRCQ